MSYEQHPGAIRGKMGGRSRKINVTETEGNSEDEQRWSLLKGCSSSGARKSPVFAGSWRLALRQKPCVCLSHLVMSNSLQPHGLGPARLLCPWKSPGKNTGVGSHSLLQGIFPTQGSNPGLLHCKWILYCLSHQGNPVIVFRFKEKLNIVWPTRGLPRRCQW